MPLRVTFDTNVLDFACRPDRFPKDPRQPIMKKVNTALTTGQLEGFYSVTMLTIEGIMRRDRAEVFASTRLVMGEEEIHITQNADLPESIRQEVGGADVETVRVEYRVDQPARAPLHPEVVARVKAAKAMGFKVLKDVPRVGAFHYKDSTQKWYLSTGEGDKLQAWISKSCEVARAIQDRGLGIAQVKRLGKDMALSNPEEAWYRCLNRPPTFTKSAPLNEHLVSGPMVTASLLTSLTASTYFVLMMSARATLLTPCSIPTIVHGLPKYTASNLWHSRIWPAVYLSRTTSRYQSRANRWNKGSSSTLN